MICMTSDNLQPILLIHKNHATWTKANTTSMVVKPTNTLGICQVLYPNSTCSREIWIVAEGRPLVLLTQIANIGCHTCSGEYRVTGRSIFPTGWTLPLISRSGIISRDILVCYSNWRKENHWLLYIHYIIQVIGQYFSVNITCIKSSYIGVNCLFLVKSLFVCLRI